MPAQSLAGFCWRPGSDYQRHHVISIRGCSCWKRRTTTRAPHEPTKIVAIGSILNEALKGGTGVYAEAVAEVPVDSQAALTDVDIALIRILARQGSKDVLIFVNRIDELPDPANQVPEIHRVDLTVRTANQAEEYLELPVLASISDRRSKRG